MKKCKIKLPKPKSLKKICDSLWRECCRARAGYKSELSGDTKILQTHHIVNKPNYRLRYELSNGICLTRTEHIYGVHSRDTVTANEYHKRILEIIGESRYAYLLTFRKRSYKTDLKLVKIYLEEQLKMIKEKRNDA